MSDCFAFVGPGDFHLYLRDDRLASPTYRNGWPLLAGESNLATVIVPPGVIHAYKNVSGYPGIVFNGPKGLYAGEGKKEKGDEIRHEDRTDSPFQRD